MTPRLARALPGVVGALFFLVLLASAAGADVVPVRIDYAAGPGCPGAAAFFRSVSTLTPNARVPAEGAPARRFTIRIEKTGGQLVGRLHIEEIDGAQAEREVNGSTCADVVGALALVTALAIDAGPINAVPPVRTAEPTPSASAPPSASARPPPTASASASTAPSSPSEDRTPPPPPAPPSPWTHRVHLGAELDTLGAVAPTAAWGPSIFFDWSGWGPTTFTPSLRIAAAVTWSPPVTTRVGSVDGTSSFRLVALRLSGCPWVLEVGPLEARPCVGIEGGVLHGDGAGLGLRDAYHQTRTWADFTPLLRLQWRFGESWVLEGQGGPLVPLIRDTFYFQEPYTVIHEVPHVSGFASLGFGVLLP